MPEQMKVNILLVDDNSTKRLALAAALEGLDLNLVTAASSREALRLVLQHDYAVILLDVQMPEMDGFEFASLIRNRERSKHTPIIFITAHSEAETSALHGYDLGAVDFIFAPVIPEILRAKVNVFIDLAIMRQNLETEIAVRKSVEKAITGLNAELESHAARLEAANKDLESFSYSISHDLRSPLRAIDGFSRVLEEEHAGKLDDEGRRVLGIVREHSKKMEQLIDGLLEFSRLGRKPIVATAIDMTRLTKQVIQELQPGSGHIPAIKLNPLADAMGDPVLIKQVWANLLSNAIKYSSGRERAEIEVGGYGDGAESVFLVKDNGAGFDMRHYDKLFGVFQRLHGVDEFPGTGVGLAIVHRVVTRHGGRVWAEGKIDGGATFYFALPGISSERERA
jgi:signal transduction histidine kinase